MANNLILAIADSPQELEVIYTNYRGETAKRRIQPLDLFYGMSEWHPGPGYLLRAIDLDRGVEREFALKDMVPA